MNYEFNFKSNTEYLKNKNKNTSANYKKETFNGVYTGVNFQNKILNY